VADAVLPSKLHVLYCVPMDPQATTATRDGAPTDSKDAKDRAYYARIAKDYFRRQDQPIQRLSTRIESSWLREQIRPGSRVLLVGVGGGREIGPLLDLECQITAIDYSPEMVEVGRVHWEGRPIEWAVADAHQLTEYADRFDVVLCLAALNYFVEPGKAMEAMASSLVSGGRLIVSSINGSHRTEHGYTAPAGHHRTLFNPKSLTRLAEDAGLRPEPIRGIRILTDSLPVAWNRPGAKRLQSTALRAILLIEPLLRRIVSPEHAKFLWLIATRP
jgi:2-polyprenyl-3-methyl-5-hydroxy-6-metoxy-1,4-benzoquinol methylase